MSVTLAKFEQKGKMRGTQWFWLLGHPYEYVHLPYRIWHIYFYSVVFKILAYINALNVVLNFCYYTSQGRNLQPNKQTRGRRRNFRRLNTRCLAGVGSYLTVRINLFFLVQYFLTVTVCKNLYVSCEQKQSKCQKVLLAKPPNW